MGTVMETWHIDCDGLSVTQINRMIQQAVDEGRQELEIVNPNSRHNLGVAIVKPIHLIYRGSVGYYAASICDQVRVDIYGNAGWAVAENLMSGEVVVHRNAATACAASLHGGTVVVKGNVGARSGIGLKGGTMIVGGDAGYMTGFMMQKGRIIICGNTGKALADSMYDGTVYVGGHIGELGNGTTVTDTPEDEYAEIRGLLARYCIDAPPSFKKVESNGQLHNFNKKEFNVWKHVL